MVFSQELCIYLHNKILSKLIPTNLETNIILVKGKGKGQSNTQKNHVSNQEPSDQVLTDRVACLEAKFGGLERRQDQLEHRITSGFDGVQDQLRQVLQAVVPRQPQQSTGMTPPPKVAKTS